MLVIKIGLYNKYEVWKDGLPADGRFFVLKPESDLAAVKALKTYARATPDAVLASDLWHWIWEIEREQPNPEKHAAAELE